MTKRGLDSTTIIIIFVAFVVGIVVGSVMFGVQLSPVPGPDTGSYPGEISGDGGIRGGGGITNAHECRADGVCEVNSLESSGAILGEYVNVGNQYNNAESNVDYLVIERDLNIEGGLYFDEAPLPYLDPTECEKIIANSPQTDRMNFQCSGAEVVSAITNVVCPDLYTDNRVVVGSGYSSYGLPLVVSYSCIDKDTSELKSPLSIEGTCCQIQFTGPTSGYGGAGGGGGGGGGWP